MKARYLKDLEAGRVFWPNAFVPSSLINICLAFTNLPPVAPAERLVTR